MMKKIKFNCELDEKVITNCDFAKGIIYNANIKPAKIVKKEINKKGIPFIKDITIWRVFIDIKLEDGFCISCIWNLENTFYIHDMIPVTNVKKPKKKSKKAKNKIKEPVIPTILRACGVSEWTELIGTTIRVKDTFGWHSTNKHTHGSPCISPADADRCGWFYPNYYQTNIKSDDNSIDSDIETKNESTMSFYETSEAPINSDSNPIEEFLDNIIKEKDGCIFKDYQDEFKNTITSLIKSEYGCSGNQNNKAYGLDMINSILETNNIGYKISIVYKTKTTPRHWKIHKVEESE